MASITNFTPALSIVGDTISIIGSGFTGTTDVRFNGPDGVVATFTIINDNLITAIVPSGATSGTISVFGTTRVFTGTAIIISDRGSSQMGILTTIPSIPADFAANPGTGVSVDLSWTDNPIATYNIYRSTTAGNETLLASGATGGTYNDATTVGGTTYYYVMTAVIDTIEGTPTLETSIDVCGTGTTCCTECLPITLDCELVTNVFTNNTTLVSANNGSAIWDGTHSGGGCSGTIHLYCTGGGWFVNVQFGDEGSCTVFAIPLSGTCSPLNLTATGIAGCGFCSVITFDITISEP